MDALTVNAVTKTFATRRAVDALSFNVPEGSIYGLLGPNGSGKTTTIRMILKILLPDSGTVQILGRDLDDTLSRRIGYLPEERGLYRAMRVEDHLVFFGALRGLNPRDARRRARTWLERFEVGAWGPRKVSELSKGMQQKVQFIGAILHDPALLILDEPFSGLDPVNTRLLKDVMLELREKGTTVILSTHQMEQVERSCDRITLIHEGRAVAQGLLADVRRAHGANHVQVEYSGPFPREGVADLVESVDDHGQYAEMRLRRAEDSGALLKRLAEAVDIRRFEVCEASLNDIFIRLVGGAR